MEDIIMLTLQHCTRQVSRSRTEKTIRETWVGTQAEVDQKINTLVFRENIANYGYLSSWDKRQRGGALYEVEIEWSLSYNPDGFMSDEEQLDQVEKSTLSTANISLPLQGARNYRTNWNYYLIALGDSTGIIPSWYYTATDTFLQPGSADFFKYRWVKQLSEVPTQQDKLTGTYWQVVKSGTTTCKPRKLGVQSYDYSTYVITEIKQFSTQQDAGAAVSKYVNRIVDIPPNGDFGVTRTNCDWKIDDAQVSFNGDKWEVTTTYTMSGYGGWDKDLYTKITESD